MPRPAIASLARQTLNSAFKALEKTITPGDAHNFSTTTLEHVKLEVLKIEEELGSRQALRNMRRLAPLFQGLEHYAKVMDILCNGTPFLPWVWAPISLILRIASEHLEAFERIIKGYSKIAECLGRFAILSHTFTNNPDFQQTLAVYYANILDFHQHAYQFVSRRCWKLFFITSWHRFQRRFDNLLEDLQRHGELVDKEANAYHIAEAKQMRQEIRVWRDKSTEQLQQTEQEQNARQYKSIVSWLKVDDTDQLNIFHRLLEDSTTYPGTCGWVLKNTKMQSALQRKPDVPVLWVHGAAGAGKSVLSSSVVNFMNNDRTERLVLCHFCNYTYLSSIKYEFILRSLLHQLVRKDEDLAAHVYENYFLEKKVPTIPVMERLLQLLLSSISKEPRQASYVWIVVDGIDECDTLTQNKVFSLINQLTSRASSPDDVICKAIISCRFSTNTSVKLRKKQSISLTEEKKQMCLAIRIYAAQRLQSIYSKFQQMNLNETDTKEIENSITEKADGMFLYARLVLDYLSNNIFFSGEEIKGSVHKLPDGLAQFKILTQILVRLDSRSIERVKCALGWIAFSKRPLKKVEFLSAIAFSSGDITVKQVAPQYMLDICASLIEERPDSSLGFIHVSVKEFLQSSSSNLVLVERDCLLQHGIATVTCLSAGIETLSYGPPEESVLVSIIRGLHGFQIYAKEYWTDYLLSLAPSDKDTDSHASFLFNMAFELATKLNQLSNNPVEFAETPDGLLAHEQQLWKQSSNEQVWTTSETLLRGVVEGCLRVRSVEQLDLDLKQSESRGQPTDEATASAISSPQQGVSLILERYQAAIRYLLDKAEYAGISATEFDYFKRQFHDSAYTCRVKGCPRATNGFECFEKCHDHEISHVRRLMCTYTDCQYPPFGSSGALRRHVVKAHNSTQRRACIRKRRLNKSPKSTQFQDEQQPEVVNSSNEPTSVPNQGVSDRSQEPGTNDMPDSGKKKGYVYRPEHMRAISVFNDQEREKYEKGLRGLYDHMEKNGPETQKHQNAKKNITEFSRMVTEKIDRLTHQQQLQLPKR